MYDLFIFREGSDNPVPDTVKRGLAFSELLKHLVTEAKGGDHSFVITPKDAAPISVK